MGLKVVVTGASTGIGRATALRFAKDGHEVFATARSDSKLSETVKLAPAGTVYKGIGDVAVEADVLRNYAEATKALGDRIDVVVLNAGTIGPSVLLEDHSTKDFDTIFNTNVRGVFFWLRAIVPLLKKQGFGQIVIVNSRAGLGTVGPEFTMYSSSKFALTGMAESLRLDVKGTGVKVASVFPGIVETPLWNTVDWDRQGVDAEQKYSINTSLTPDDVANAIAYVAYQGPRSNIDKIILPTNDASKKASSTS